MSNQTTLTHYTTDQIKNPILLAEHFAKSGYFKDTADVSKAVVKIIAGQELGFGPMASMSGFHIIQGKPTLSANLMASAIKRSGKYNFRVKEITDKVCTIEFFEGKESCGVSTFTIEEAKVAGTQNLTKFPKNMLYARALSNGAKWFCPDVLNGSPIYTPEELGADVNEEGEVVQNESVEVEPEIEYITDAQLKKLLKESIPTMAEIKGVSIEDMMKTVCGAFKVGGLGELTKGQAIHAIDNLETKIAKAKSETVTVTEEAEKVTA